jgi:hypothetical protein
MPFSNELDIFVSQNTKEKIWNMGYIDLAILLRNNFTVPNEMQNCMRHEKVLNLKVPHHLQYLNRFGLPEDLVAAELVAERLAALVLLEWDLVSGALVVSVVVFVHM